MRVRKELFKENLRIFPFLLTVIIILLFYHLRWGLTILDPTYINWVINNTELSNGFFSFGYFRFQPLEFPIGKINDYFYPLGTNLYTSDIPLLALFFKPLSPLLPIDFQYIGIWYFICHLLQAWFAILLCERLGIKGISKLLFAVFLLFAPVLMFRYMHPSLFCQWMILASLWIYLLDPDKVPVKKILFYQLCVFLASGLEFAYMWAMIFGFSVALFWRLCLIDKKIKPVQAIVHFSIHTIIMISIWLLIGLFSFESIPNYQMEGWGAFTINLNGLYNPMGTASLLPNQPYNYPQYEGYIYLGAGGLLLLAVSTIYFFKIYFKKNAPSHKKGFTLAGTNLLPLSVFFLFSTLFALSNTIRLNDQILLQYSLPDLISGLINSFRSSGRFFWPVYYFIFVALFYVYNKINLKSIYKNFFLAVCLVIQLYDLQGFLKPVDIKYESYQPPINPVWEEVIKSFDATIFYPGFRRSFLTFDDYRYFTYYTTIHRKKINMGYPARFDAVKAAALIGELGNKITEKGLDDNTLYISDEPFLNRFIVPIYYSESYCLNLDNYLILIKKSKKNESIYKLLIENGATDESEKIISSSTFHTWSENIDLLVTNKAKASFYETDQSDDHLFLKGWAFDEKSSSSRTDSIYVVLESFKTKTKWISSPAYRFGTQDVVDYFKKADVDYVGFGISSLITNLKEDSYRTGILFRNKATQVNSLLWLDHNISISKPVNANLTSIPGNVINDIKFDINVFKDEEKETLIEAWAFTDSNQCAGCKCYYTLVLDNDTYAAEARTIARQDVADFFHNPALVNSGRNIRINKKSLKPGNYKVGILLKDTINQVNHFTATDKIVSVKKTLVISALDTEPVGKDSILASIDVNEKNDQEFLIEGWAFISSVESQKSKTYLVLKSSSALYKAEVNTVNRPDVQNAFKVNYSIQESGFKALIKENDLQPGKYQICIMMENLENHQETLRCLDSYLLIE
jgi:hypothetical protein